MPDSNKKYKREFHRSSRTVRRSKLGSDGFYSSDTHQGKGVFAPESGRRSYAIKEDIMYSSQSPKKPKNKKPWQHSYVNYDQADQQEHPRKDSYRGGQGWRKSDRFLSDRAYERKLEQQKVQLQGMERRWKIPEVEREGYEHYWSSYRYTYPSNWDMINE